MISQFSANASWHIWLLHVNMNVCAVFHTPTFSAKSKHGISFFIGIESVNNLKTSYHITLLSWCTSCLLKQCSRYVVLSTTEMCCAFIYSLKYMSACILNVKETLIATYYRNGNASKCSHGT